MDQNEMKDHEKAMEQRARMRDAAEDMFAALVDFVLYMGEGETPGEQACVRKALAALKKAKPEKHWDHRFPEAERLGNNGEPAQPEDSEAEEVENALENAPVASNPSDSECGTSAKADAKTIKLLTLAIAQAKEDSEYEYAGDLQLILSVAKGEIDWYLRSQRVTTVERACSWVGIDLDKIEERFCGCDVLEPETANALARHHVCELHKGGA